MVLSQKTQYALRAVFELARRFDEGPIRVADIAEAQAIPPKFLVVILHQMKGAKFIASKRGVGGGYYLLRHPRKLNVGEVIEFIQGTVKPVDCVVGRDRETCRLRGCCVFRPLWDRVEEAVDGVVGTTSFQALVDSEAEGVSKVKS